MALAECRRFPILPQALVARSALEAAGLHPIVFDSFRASIFWTDQFALGGIRLMVPEDEFEPAHELLSDVERSAPSTPDYVPVLREPGAFLLFLGLCILVGWPLAGFRIRDPFHQGTALVVSILLFIIPLSSWVANSIR